MRPVRLRRAFVEFPLVRLHSEKKKKVGSSAEEAISIHKALKNQRKSKKKKRGWRLPEHAAQTHCGTFDRKK